MPRYLGLDYLSEAFNSRRQFINQSVLTIPQHLEIVGHYAHSGYIPDSLYRLPWTRAKPEDDFISKEDAGTELKTLFTELKAPGIEKIEWGDVSDTQIVPSSNPASQDDVPSDSVNSLGSVLQYEQICNSQLPSEKVEPLEIHQEKTKDDLLEDVISTDPFTEYLLKVPVVHSLVSKLEQFHVQDPFKQYSLTAHPTGLFREDIILDIDETVNNKDELQTFEETFDKEELYQKSQQDAVEETLCQCETGLPPQSVNYIDQEIQDSLVIETLEENDHLQEVKLHVELSSKVPKSAPEVAQLDMPDVPVIKSTSFVELNGGREFEKMLPIEPLLLDGFVCDTTIEPEKHESLLTNLSPIRDDPEIELNLYSPNTTSRLIDSWWKEERCINEMLELCIKEPAIPSEQVTLDHPIIQVRQLEHLKKLVSTLDEELSLAWDLAASFKVKPKRKPSVEPIQVKSSISNNIIQKSDLKEVEEFEKYPSVLFHDWHDPLLKPPAQDSRFGKLKAAILARQEKDKISSLPATGIRPEKRKRPEQETLGTREKTSNGFSSSVKVSNDRGGKCSEDPLGDFLFMRSTRNVLNQKTTVPPADPSCDNPFPIKAPKAKNLPVEKAKSKIITVQMTGDYGEAAGMIIEFSQPVVKHLHETGMLPEHQHLITIPPDMTRFLLKETQKQNKVNGEKSLVLLHIFCCVLNVYLHCSLEAAICCLSAMEQKYQDILQGCLGGVRTRLFELQCLLKEKRVLHPKLKEILSYTEDWVQKKKLKDPEFDPKILVMVRRDISGLLSHICQTMSTSSLITPAVFNEQDTSYHSLLNSLDKANCIIIAVDNILNSFPWSQFSLVVEYEHQPDKGYMELCQRQNIRYLGLKVDPNRINIEKKTFLPSYETPSDQLFLVCSQRLTANTNLLQILENRFNCVLIEKDMSNVKTDNQFADILFDVKTGMLLYNMNELTNQSHAGRLYRLVTSFHLRLSHLWLLLYSTDKNSGLDSSKSGYISKLQRDLIAFSANADDFVVELMTCKELCEVAQVIRTIGENVQRNTDLMVDLSQLQERNINSDEKHLLLFPCFNAVSAQMILKIKSLDVLMEMTYQDLEQTFPFLPPKVIQSFCNLRTSSLCSSHENVQKVVPNKSNMASIGEEESQDGEVAQIMEDAPQTKLSPEYQINGGLSQSTDFSHRSKTSVSAYTLANGCKSRSSSRPNQEHFDPLMDKLQSPSSLSKICNDGLPVSEMAFSDGYGDFQISLSPSLTECEPEKKQMSPEPLQQDSEECNWLKPNEFTMAELEGKMAVKQDIAFPNESFTVSDTSPFDESIHDKRENCTKTSRMYDTGNNHRVPTDSLSRATIVSPSYLEHSAIYPYPMSKNLTKAYGEANPDSIVDSAQKYNFLASNQNKVMTFEDEYHNNKNLFDRVTCADNNHRRIHQLSVINNNIHGERTPSYVNDFMSSFQNSKQKANFSNCQPQNLPPRAREIKPQFFDNQTSSFEESPPTMNNNQSTTNLTEPSNKKMSNTLYQGQMYSTCKAIQEHQNYRVGRNFPSSKGSKSVCTIPNEDQFTKSKETLVNHGQMRTNNDYMINNASTAINRNHSHTQGQNVQFDNRMAPTHSVTADENHQTYSSRHNAAQQKMLMRAKNLDYDLEQVTEKHLLDQSRNSGMQYWSEQEYADQQNTKAYHPRNALHSNSFRSTIHQQNHNDDISYTRNPEPYQPVLHYQQQMHLRDRNDDISYTTNPRSDQPSRHPYQRSTLRQTEYYGASWRQPGVSRQPSNMYPRLPPHRVSIGLAQPFPRNKQTAEKPVNVDNDTTDSPPMDLDSDEEQTLFKPHHKASDKTSRNRLGQQGNGHYSHGQNLLRQVDVNDETEVMALIPSKKKRLGLQKVPGARGGQTRLTFS